LKVTDVSLPEAAADADLGGSSKYSSEILEGQCGEGPGEADAPPPNPQISGEP